jgi:CheY-like chemotaxis protein
MRLLVAEDDRALGLFLKRGLEADGHRVRLALDGVAAVDSFREDLPDLTILDLNLPRRDGEQVLSDIRRMDTSRARRSVRSQPLPLGCERILPERNSKRTADRSNFGVRAKET